MLATTIILFFLILKVLEKSSYYNLNISDVYEDSFSGGFVY